MMVPRSYAHSSPTPTYTSIRKEKDVRTVEGIERMTSIQSGKRKDSEKLAKPPTMLSPPPPTPSEPMVIPTRTRKDVRRKSRSPDEEINKPSKIASSPHDPSSVPSSVAALLAMTSIPEPKKFGTESHIKNVKYKDSDRKLVVHSEHLRRTLSSSSPQTWDFLLSPPNEDLIQSGSFESDTTMGPLSSVRSISTESMPSLETDEESLYSASSPGTPGFNNGRAYGRQKSLSASKGEECLLDHPLLPMPSIRPKYETLESRETNPETDLSQEYKPLAQTRSTFKSNLTASFRVLRSAARSFSNFTTPATIQRDEYLTRSLLSIAPQFTDERRPLPLTEPPEPALRRYLNPITLSAAELHHHAGHDRTSAKASIQLQSYQRGPRHSKHASSPPVFISQQKQKDSPSKRSLDTEDSFTSSLLPRQREPRENCNFLRVVVLEMNMRKVGKLSDTSPGRARLWLPARPVANLVAVGPDDKEEDSKSDTGSEAGRGKRIPRRWAEEQS